MQAESIIVSASVILHVQIPNVDEWYIFTQSKTYELIPEPYEALKSGMKPIKNVQQLNEL